MKNVGSRLKQLRLAYDLSGALVADKIGLSANQLWNVERGDSVASSVVVAKLSKVYKISLDLLFFGDEQTFMALINKIYAGEVQHDHYTLQGYGRARA